MHRVGPLEIVEEETMRMPGPTVVLAAQREAQLYFKVLAF
jgi:hypothetical protein